MKSSDLPCYRIVDKLDRLKFLNFLLLLVCFADSSEQKSNWTSMVIKTAKAWSSGLWDNILIYIFTLNTTTNANTFHCIFCHSMYFRSKNTHAMVCVFVQFDLCQFIGSKKFLSLSVGRTEWLECFDTAEYSAFN